MSCRFPAPSGLRVSLVRSARRDRQTNTPVDQSADLVRLVHDGDSAKRRAGSAAYERSRREGLHAAVAEWKRARVADGVL